MNDGGPAFPIPDFHGPNGQVQPGSNGMSLRDAFALVALPALIQVTAPLKEVTPQDVVKAAWDYADDALKARDK